MRKTPTTPKMMVEWAKNRTSIENEGNAEHKKRDDFPARQPGEIMAEEKKRETNCGDDSRQTSRPEF